MKPEVSVVIPTYNRATSVRAAIESVLVQTVREIEVIVVDDGSDDGTADVVGAIVDRRIRLVAHDCNRGASAARNSGIAAASADLIALLDSDDSWSAQKLERQIAAFELQPEVDAVICGVRMILLDQGRSFDAVPAPADDWLERLLADCGLNPGATLLARRAAFERVGPMDETLARFEDWDWLVRYAAAGGSLSIVPEVLATVNNRRGRLGRETEEAAGIFLRKHAALRARYGSAFDRRAEADVWMQVAGTYAFASAWGGFARTFARAIVKDPVHCAARLLRALRQFGAAPAFHPRRAP